MTPRRSAYCWIRRVRSPHPRPVQRMTRAVSATSSPKRSPGTAVIVPLRSSAVPSETVGTTPTQRDRHLQTSCEHGRRRWQKTSDYHWRALVEAEISRFKRVIGDGLRSRTDRRRGTEIAFAISVLNHMLELGRPECVRLA